jgi:ligand-binding SRPBCC domain-containing protein
MPVIKLVTEIHAPVERVFDLSRSIDLHKLTTAKTGEEAIAGKTSGLIGLGEFVTWRATHLGVRQTLTSRITKFKYPHSFTDQMMDGAFKAITHEHRFESDGDTTVMTDLFHFESPLGILGKIANAVFLTDYLKSFIESRNKIIKEYAESNKWKEILGEVNSEV